MIMFLAARADFGFGNPNLAAAFFAMLAVGVWGFCGGGRCLGCKNRSAEKNNPQGGAAVNLHLSMFWVCLVICSVFTGLLVATASRGGAVALAAGLFACWIAAGFPKSTRRGAFGITLAVCVVFGFAVTGRMGGRVAESSLEDGSITSRLAILEKDPAMMAAAPGGWGRGNATEAYQNWFQERDDTRTYKHLLSTHATWMVERGWGFRFLYVFGWLAVFALCWKTPASFGVWLAFGVAGVFSHVGGDWRLGIVPGLALGLAVSERACRGDWPAGWMWRSALAAAVGVALLLAVAGCALNRERIFQSRGSVTVGRGKPGTWFIFPDRAVLGAAYGKAVRARKSAGVAWEIQTLITVAPRRIVLSGRAAVPEGAAFVPPYELVWLNPPAKLDNTQRLLVENGAKKTIVWGELRTDANPRELKAWVELIPRSRWVAVKGNALFLGGSESENLF